MLLNEILGYAGKFVIVNGYTFEEHKHARDNLYRIEDYNIKLSDVEDMFKQMIRRVIKLQKNHVEISNIFLYSKSTQLPIVLKQLGEKHFLIVTYLPMGTSTSTKNSPKNTAHIILEGYGKLRRIEIE
jgi:hypothetical protein